MSVYEVGFDGDSARLALCSFVVYVAVHKTADYSAKLQFITVVHDTSFVAQRQILMVQSILFCTLVVDVPVCIGFPQVQSCGGNQL